MKQKYVSNFVCPKCQNKFAQSPRARFGPAKVRCGSCGEVLATNLREWATLPPGGKVFQGVLEVVDPFHAQNVLSFILYHAVFFLIISIPLGFLIAGLKLHPSGLQSEALKKWNEVAPFLIGGVIYVALLISLLIRKIGESQKYTTTGMPPTWK